MVSTLFSRWVHGRREVVESVPAWFATRNHIARLSAPPKHQMVDPALAARLLGVDADALLAGRSAGPTTVHSFSR
jgi:hypothetical protein